MADKDHKQVNAGWPKANDALGRELDAALTKYTNVEPRAGLEERVLANLRAERASVQSRTGWRWTLAGAVTAVVLLAVAVAWRRDKPSHPRLAEHATPTAQTPNDPPTQMALNRGSRRVSPSAPTSTKTISAHRIPPAFPASGPPKLDQFPSPQPPTPEELALRRYVSEFPREATLIAQAQEEFESEIEQKMDVARPQIDGKNFDQQER